jgi:hypothetical protein
LVNRSPSPSVRPAGRPASRDLDFGTWLRLTINTNCAFCSLKTCSSFLIKKIGEISPEREILNSKNPKMK